MNFFQSEYEADFRGLVSSIFLSLNQPCDDFGDIEKTTGRYKT